MEYEVRRYLSFFGRAPFHAQTHYELFSKNIDSEIDLLSLKTIFLHHTDDPMLFNEYPVDEEAYEKLLDYLPWLRSYPIREFDIYVSCESA